MACRVMKVRDFQRLAKLSEADGHLQQRLKQLLKLSKEKWDSACEHAKTAVQVRQQVVLMVGAHCICNFYHYVKSDGAIKSADL